MRQFCYNTFLVINHENDYEKSYDIIYQLLLTRKRKMSISSVFFHLSK